MNLNGSFCQQFKWDGIIIFDNEHMAKWKKSKNNWFLSSIRRNQTVWLFWICDLSIKFKQISTIAMNLPLKSRTWLTEAIFFLFLFLFLFSSFFRFLIKMYFLWLEKSKKGRNGIQVADFWLCMPNQSQRHNMKGRISNKKKMY